MPENSTAPHAGQAAGNCAGGVMAQNVPWRPDAQSGNFRTDAAPRVYVSMSRLRVPAQRSDALVAAFRDRLGAVDHHDGFVDLQVWRNDRDAGDAWCRHDNQWILHWALEDLDGTTRLDDQLRWLAGVLDAREVAVIADRPELGRRLTRAAEPLRTWPH